MALHRLLKSRDYLSWGELETEIENLQSNHEKGMVFEQFCFFFLNYFRDLYQITNVYSDIMPANQTPRSLKRSLRLSNIDDGVDGVFVTTNGDKVAYQCKFRTGRVSPTSNELNNFWAEAEYANRKMVLANCSSLPRDVRKRSNASFVLGYHFDSLDAEFFRYLYKAANGYIASDDMPQKHQPRDYQKPMIEAAVEGFKKHNRGKIIAACASGKTLVSLWISEALKCKLVLFLTPNLALVRQTIENWTQNANDPIAYLAVCSDDTVAVQDEDTLTVDIDERDIYVTTDSSEVSRFLTWGSEYKKVVFSTYQSIDCIIEGFRDANAEAFDLIIYDEAHRTAGASITNLFGKSLDDDEIQAKKRLFMTATERLVKPHIIERFEQEDRVILSMDDNAKYGPVFYRLPFGKAIADGVIADYKIVVAVMTSEEVAEIVERNKYLQLTRGDVKVINEVSAQLAFKVALLIRVAESVNVRKIISFHSRVPAAIEFCQILESWIGERGKTSIEHINGTYSAKERAEIFSDFVDSDFGLISNVRCLTEGVDIPYIDAIIFVDPRRSLIDIVQAVGRALRKPYGVKEKTSYIVVPIIVNEETGLADDEVFIMMHNIIQALRDQDEMLADWIDRVNLGVVRGRGGSEISDDDGRLMPVLSQSIDLKPQNDFKYILKGVDAQGHTPIYKMHRYFARRPQNVFSELIQFYSAEGDVVLDPFCGGGATLVEGVALERKVIACDINPLATFISKTETTRVDYEEYVREISNIRNKVEEKCGHWFFTRDRDTGELLPVRWYEHAYLISCPTCHKDYPLSNSNKNKVDGRDINGWYICPHCKQASQAVDNPSIGSQMINVTYKVSTRKTQRTVQPSAEDINLEASARVQLDQARKENVLKFPDVEIPLRWDRQQEDCLERKGFIKFSDFFSPRNLLAMAYFLHFIKRRKHHVSKDVYDLLLLTFSATLRYTNNMTISTPSWQDGRPVAWAKHAYWLPYQFVEVNPIEYIDKRISAIKSALRYQRKHLPLASPANNYAELTKDNNTFLILTQDSSKLPIPDESVDLVLTDPPYGSNVQYGELSAFWLSWLYEELGITVDDILDLTGEILIHRKKKSEAKSYNYYYEGLSRVFSECYRVLKNDSPIR